MLVLRRRLRERVKIGEDIWVEILRIDGQEVRIGIAAPPDVAIVRDELLRRDAREAAAARGAETIELPIAG